jgi:hypothetical protein
MPSQLPTDPALAALFAQHGMVHVERDISLPGAMSLLGGIHLDAFVHPDGSMLATRMPASGPNKTMVVNSTLGFSIPGVQLPPIGAARKGVSSPIHPGEVVGFESIDFGDRFEVRSNDRRAAVMLIDEGMMQWLMDCDRVSFTAMGDKVSSVVVSASTRDSGVADYELLFRFREGFLARVPDTVRSEFASRGEPPKPFGF